MYRPPPTNAYFLNNLFFYFFFIQNKYLKILNDGPLSYLKIVTCMFVEKTCHMKENADGWPGNEYLELENILNVTMRKTSHLT